MPGETAAAGMMPGFGKSLFDIGTTYLSGLVGQATSGNGRINNERFVENENRANISTANDVGRYNTFLSGITGTQADNYNKYQDATFGQDTQREIDRIKAQAEGLGMSPWELKGAQGAAQPAPAFTGGGAQPGGMGKDFMAQMIPMKIAQMQNKTQVQTAMMNNQTALKLKEMDQGGGQLSGAQVKQTQGNTAYTQALTDKTQLDNVINSLNFIYDKLPEQKFDLAIGAVSSKQGWDKVVNAFRKSDLGSSGKGPTQFSNTNDAVRAAIASLEKDEQAQFFKDLESAVKAGAKQAQGAFNEAGQGLGQFLKGMIK